MILFCFFDSTLINFYCVNPVKLEAVIQDVLKIVKIC